MDELKKLRRRVALERAQGHGPGGKRYSEELRRDVAAFLRAERKKGTSPNRLAPALGLSLPTAYQWSSKGKGARRQKAFRRVSIVARTADEVARESKAATAGQIVVTGPGGLQAVGLGVAELAELLRRLGC
jgi:hypothetical protein